MLNASAAETRRAIDVAHSALPASSTMPLNERVALMRRLHQAIVDNLAALAAVLTDEPGKPLSDIRAEVGSSATYMLWFAGGAAAPRALSSRPRSLAKKLPATHYPIGAVAGITPRSFPSFMPAFSTGVSQPRPIRGPQRPHHCQKRRVIPSTPRGALHYTDLPLRTSR